MFGRSASYLITDCENLPRVRVGNLAFPDEVVVVDKSIRTLTAYAPTDPVNCINTALRRDIRPFSRPNQSDSRVSFYCAVIYSRRSSIQIVYYLHKQAFGCSALRLLGTCLGRQEFPTMNCTSNSQIASIGRESGLQTSHKSERIRQ